MSLKLRLKRFMRPEIDDSGASLVTKELALDIDYRLINAQDTYALHEMSDAQDEWKRIRATRHALQSVFGPLAMHEHDGLPEK